MVDDASDAVIEDNLFHQSIQVDVESITNLGVLRGEDSSLIKLRHWVKCLLLAKGTPALFKRFDHLSNLFKVIGVSLIL